jgi:hypothetical protein
MASVLELFINIVSCANYSSKVVIVVVVVSRKGADI